MSVEARCHRCDDVHPVGDRRRRRGTTACPACGSPEYDSHSTDGRITKPEAERIADAVRDVDGVGADTLANVQATFSLFVELEAAGRPALLAIEGVGRQTADGILAALAGDTAR